MTSSKASASVAASAADSVPAAAAARRRSGVEALVTPAGHARPAGEVDDRHEAAVLEVEPPAVLAGVLDDEPAQEAGRRAVGEREARELAQQRRVAARVAERLGERDRRCASPHTVRLSTTTETRISACSCVGSSSQLRAARCHEASERTSSGFAAVVPRSSGRRPQAHEPVVDAAADRQRVLDERLVLGRRRARPSALSTSEPGRRLAPRHAAQRQPGERDVERRRRRRRRGR